MIDLFCEEMLFNINSNVCTGIIALHVQFFISLWNVSFSLHYVILRNLKPPFDFEPVLMVNAHVGIVIQK